MRHNAVYQEEVVTWEYLKMFYEEDIRRLPRTAPKLSNKHLFLPAFGEMRVGVAAETLSASVAAAIRFYVDKEVLLLQSMLKTSANCLIASMLLAVP